ncbi:MAG: hypothetical protein QNJ54_13565 [Prochloraceae cyanobacterium]|nr:hypothetical protein [Prochloraceae cyanobacterium]
MLHTKKERLSISFLFSLTLLLAAAQMPFTRAENLKAQESEAEARPLTQVESLLSLEGGKRLMQEASEAIDSERYEIAAKKLQEARQVFNQLSQFYLQLANSFSGIEPKIFEQQRRNALQTGQMRDEATYQLALVHRAQNKPELSVPLLIQVIRSQNPTSELGKKSYQQLYELGFVDAPYERSTGNSKTDVFGANNENQ